MTCSQPLKQLTLIQRHVSRSQNLPKYAITVIEPTTKQAATHEIGITLTQGDSSAS